MQAQRSEECFSRAETANLSWISGVLDHLHIGIGIFDEGGALAFANDRFAGDFALATGPGDAPFICAYFHLSGFPMEKRAHPCVCLVTEQRRDLGEDEFASPGCDVALRQEQAAADFRRFAESSSNAIVIASLLDGTVDYSNAAARAIWPIERICGSLSEWEQTVHPDDRTVARGHRSEALEGRPQRFEYRIVGASGEVVRHVRESCFPISVDEGTANSIGAIVEDISPPLQIYLIQPDSPENSAIEDGLRKVAHGLRSFETTDRFLDVAEILAPGCVIVDVRTTSIPVERLLEILGSRPSEMQVVFVGPRDTTAAQVVDVLKAGASDYLLEPLDPVALQSSLYRACRPLWDWHPRKEARVGELNEQLLALPRREREVLLGLVAGGTNKVIARALKLSPRTVEVHRCHLMQRLNVRTLTELLHVAHEAGLRA